MPAKYKVRFMFDYQSGGCLWSDNDAAYEKFGVGCLDTEIYDMDGNIVEEAKMKLPASIRHRVLELDNLYSESLNWNDPAGQSMWDNAQWKCFHEQTRELHRQIALTLGNDFEVVYKQE